MILRNNQKRTLTKLYDWFRCNAEGNPVVDACVASGKSVLIAQLCKDAAFGFDTNSRVLMIVPSKELCEQNLSKLEVLAAELVIGVCSASLGRDETYADTDVIIGTIGTLSRRGAKLGKFELVIVDECHLISRENSGVYRQLINTLTQINAHLRVIGFTGTPYRGNGIWLTDGKDRLFTDIAARLTMRELLDDGYLSPLVNAETGTHISGDGLRISAGDYVISDLAARIDQPGINETISEEIVRIGQTRNRWLVYGVTRKHATHLRDAIRSFGVSCELITGETPKKERESIIKAFRAGRIRCISNVACLTTGFDVPELDYIALVRNTRSPVLAVQIAGRGMRLAPGKENQIKGRKAPERRDNVQANVTTKVCDNCGAVNPIAATNCHCCGQVFTRPVSKVNTRASNAPILSNGQPDIKEWTVDRMLCFPKRSASGNDYLQIVFHCGCERVTDCLMIGAHGFAGHMAETRWRQYTDASEYPRNAGEAYRLLQESVVQLRRVASVTVDVAKRYPEIKSVTYEIPDFA
jgi:DNA repair protein RadD